MNNIFVLSQDQLKVLLLICGFTKVKGITFEKNIVDDQVFVSALNELMKSELVENTGTVFQVKEELRHIINILGSSEDVTIIRSDNINLPDLYCYGQECIMICNSRGFSQGYFSLYITKKNQLLEILESEGYLPKIFSNDYFDDSKLDEYENTFVHILEKPLDSDSPVLFSFEKNIFNSFKHKYIRVIKYHFFNYILFGDEFTKERCLYSHEKLKRKILKLLEY